MFQKSDQIAHFKYSSMGQNEADHSYSNVILHIDALPESTSISHLLKPMA